MTLNSSVQARPGRSLTIRGDDLGMTLSSVKAHRQCLKDGVQTCTELLVLGPWAAQAARWLREEPQHDVGLHLALSCEWDALSWRPLTACPSLRDQFGRPPAFITPHPAYPGRDLAGWNWQLSDIQAELTVQIEWGLHLVPHATHLSFHMGFVRLAPEIKTLVTALSAQYHLDIPEFRATPVTYEGPHSTLTEKMDNFQKMLAELPAQGQFLFIDHPDLLCAETLALGHVGYEAVARDRQDVTDLFLSPELRDALGRYSAGRPAFP